MILIKLLLHFIFYSTAILISILCIYLDVNILHNGLSETSITEIMQELILFSIVCVHLWLSWSWKEQRQCNILIAGFFMAMLIRELDAFFDIISHGSWFWFALFVTAIAIISVIPQRKNVNAQLARYTHMTSWGAMMSGLLAVLVFSRLFGMSMLWQNILHSGYLRVVKNIIEEECELFGYILCLIATLMYVKERMCNYSDYNNHDNAINR